MEVVETTERREWLEEAQEQLRQIEINRQQLRNRLRKSGRYDLEDASLLKQMARQIDEAKWLLDEYQADEDKAWAFDKRRKRLHEGIRRQ